MTSWLREENYLPTIYERSPACMSISVTECGTLGLSFSSSKLTCLLLFLFRSCLVVVLLQLHGYRSWHCLENQAHSKLDFSLTHIFSAFSFCNNPWACVLDLLVGTLFHSSAIWLLVISIMVSVAKRNFLDKKWWLHLFVVIRIRICSLVWILLV